MPYELAQEFSVKGVRFSQCDQVTILEIENPWASAKMTPHGASVLSYIPKSEGAVASQPDLLWVSPEAVYNARKPVRGGIPVCWPWFGKTATALDSELPAHGFVRNLVWQLDQISHLDSQATEVVFSCKDSAQTLALWPHQFHLQLRITIGEQLTLALTTTNLNAYDLVITEAFHSYFALADVKKCIISGLAGARHIDTLTQNPESLFEGDIIMQPPMDSVFLNQSGSVVIHDLGHQRQILIEKSQAISSVVWNPGSEIIKGFSDMANEAWTDFVCVEAGNVFDNTVKIPAGKQHSMTMTLSSRTLIQPNNRL